MYLLYADESGSIGNGGERHFVLAGVSVFERQTHWIEQELNQIANRFFPGQPYAVELHGSPMKQGRSGWDQFPRLSREQAIRDALTIIVNLYPRQVRLFAAVLEKSHFSGQDVAQVAFEQLSSRFDQFLGRLYRQKNDAQRGLILFDESSTEQRIQTLAREFKYTGHTFGVTRNYAEVPVFIDSKATRLIQLADLVAYALYRNFEQNDPTYYNLIAHCFDSEGGVVHGLYHR